MTSFFASGDSTLTYNLGTATFSATATGNTYSSALDALTETLTAEVNDYLAAHPTYIVVTILYDNIKCIESTPLELYYNIVYIKVGDKYVIVNQEKLDFIPYIPAESTYSGLTHQCMTNKDGSINNNIISFAGYRTPGRPQINLPPLYDESPSILMVDGSYVSAEKLYIDSGTGFATTKPYVIYDISSASGIFSNYKFMKIIFDNTDPLLYKRVVQFY